VSLAESSTCIKAALHAVVNFINTKRTNFSYERHVLAAFSSYMYVEKWHSYETFVCKLMKLTPGPD